MHIFILVQIDRFYSFRFVSVKKLFQKTAPPRHIWTAVFLHLHIGGSSNCSCNVADNTGVETGIAN